MPKKKANKNKQTQYLCDTAHKSDWEGGILGGYAGYGLDWKAVTMLGFDETEVRNAVNLLETLEERLMEYIDKGENPYEI